MSVVPDNAVIAVDGGGTRCRLVLEMPSARHAVEVGSANVTTNFSSATSEILKGLRGLATRAGCTLDDLHSVPAYFGLAGVTGARVAQHVGDAMPLAHTRVEDDRPSALRGALGARDGAIAHCGTGSFLALQVGADTRLAGGWGSVLGDESSAMWVGRLALTETLRAADGLVERSPLIEEIHEILGDTADIVAFAASAMPSDFGRFARQVTQHADHDDIVARSILQQAADVVAVALPQLGWEPGMALCLTGGIGPVYRDYLPWSLSDALIQPAGEPIDGAVSLAREFAAEVTHEYQ
ncbi:MAG: BadF/BadG/BcrA/BcrD ATPase family protein [Paracoccaceae bacterium]